MIFGYILDQFIYYCGLILIRFGDSPVQCAADKAIRKAVLAIAFDCVGKILVMDGKGNGAGERQAKYSKG
jgi:hypothetical protein